MHLASPAESEIRITLETMVEVVNAIRNDRLELRRQLDEAGFTRAPKASKASLERLAARIEASVVPLVEGLPEAAVADATAQVNEELTELPIAPAVVDHSGVGAHLHWTPPTATFDDQVMADLLMSLAYELCDVGTARFGRCGADDCGDLYFDTTRNRSRRFCADPRCASRTHTARHRARRRDAS